MSVFVVHHMVWGRKPSYSALRMDGVFAKWDDAFETAVRLAINPEPDPGEIKDDDATDDTKPVDKLPTTKEELAKLFSVSANDVRFDRNGVTSFWDSQHGEDSRFFEIVSVNF